MTHVVTLTTDFGAADGYVAAMKGVILGINPGAVIVDVSHDVPPQDIRSAAFLVFPSESYETFGMGILEAYLAGKPVVASNLGAYPELVEDGTRGGLLFAAGDAADLASKLDRLSRDEALRKSLGRAGLEYALRAHDPELHYGRLMDAYERVTGHA